MYIADLHIHSRYSRATSRDCDLAHLDLWARRKGIGMVGTGDFTHPAWREEMRNLLEPAGEGVYALRDEARLPDDTAGAHPPRFVVTGEISCIYKKNGRVRKVHNLIVLPGLDAAEQIARRLEAVGNVHSDGRPILGMDSRDLMALTLDACPQALFIPAHIWTPHFSLFGAFSGFDDIEECFEDLTPHICALETGLSSDPPMNWRVSALDRFTLISNSDAHSPAKLGREANLLRGEASYPVLAHALQTGEGFEGTIEFFPEEGKYHLDGHRACKVCLTPAETERCGRRCPVCGGKITIGVQHRVEQLADRSEGFVLPGAHSFESMAPLNEVIGASLGVSAESKAAQTCYAQMLGALGSEFYILREADLGVIEAMAGPCISEGIRRLREGRVERTAGYDGEYGRISILLPEEIARINGQTAMFGCEPRKAKAKETIAHQQPAKREKPQAKENPVKRDPLAGLNPQQLEAATSTNPVVCVVAGPGTGKTGTLVARVAWLIGTGVPPSEITAVTFTRQAAEEMRARLEKLLGGKRALKGLTVGTFHAICLRSVGETALIDPGAALELAAEISAALQLKMEPHKLLRLISQRKNGAMELAEKLPDEAYERYNEALKARGARDFDDLLLDALDAPAQSGFAHLLVDEFQDINELQYRLVRRWNEGGKSLFVIGDPDQAIYRFRGASARCFERLQADMPAHLVTLTQNYRSTPQILGSAIPVISRNEGGERHLCAQRAEGALVRVVCAPGEFSEAVFIAKEIGRMTGGVDMLTAQAAAPGEMRAFSDMAVLCRTHRQTELIEACLRHDDIPCVISGRGDFLEDEAVRGVLDFFRALLNPQDEGALRDALRRNWNAAPEEIAAALDYNANAGGWDESAARAALDGSRALSAWIDAVARYAPAVRKEKPHRLLDRWIRENDGGEALERLRSMAAFSPDMAALLQDVALGQEADLRRASGAKHPSEAVRVMTLHGAKGLEFPVVFLAFVRAGSIPLDVARTREELAEERRLFYVGMTRARDELVLTTSGEPSMFLGDLPGRFVREECAPRRRSDDVGEQLSLF